MAIATLSVIAVGGPATIARAADADGDDFGLQVQRLLRAQSLKFLGVRSPLAQSALGPFAGASQDALQVAPGLKVHVVSNATDPQADQIALWPDDASPTHLFVCVENFFTGNDPDVISVQRIALNGDPDSNAETIVKGISSCDPIRRTPWGTLVVGEESGADGGVYEIFDPLSISAANPVIVTDRAAGTVVDAGSPVTPRVVKRKAVGALSLEGLVLLPDGTMYYGDESRPSSGKAGGGVYKFVPTNPRPLGAGPITSLSQSPVVAGSIFGLRLGSTGTDYGQGSEIGRGAWVAINAGQFADPNGNVVLRNAQVALSLTGYYRPEDMDRDPIATAQDIVRVCWANTGRTTNGGDSAIEGGANWGEVQCLTDDPAFGVPGGAIPLVERFVAGDQQLAMPDNVAFQPHTGNLVVLEDGEVEVLNPDGSVKEERGNDIWMCLPDGADRDGLSDGCVRIASLRDTGSEPTGFIFDASGENAYVNLQHRSTGQGALVKISGFRVKK
jgi:hypothetical protein